MGIFDRFKSQRDIAKKELKNVPWQELNKLDQLNEIKNNSKERPQVLFKHSTRCSISSMALSRFEREYDVEDSKADIYYLDLIVHRDISNAIAEEFNVQHQSPQVIVLKDNEVVYTASHNAISAKEIEVTI
ncbi:bacillithiol system redox-active protein YtxJ [Gangjinia marincola]|uniref:Bacillithiol system redox-active protein YtxJ n=1 Tax=Gangjinia marincola TaxID=578463 RepID=A0ABN1MGV7_9FLAO